ncbi:hypothetical protein BDN70DRAFT_159988 [Pholiota conissans]|uniref:Uncharacterized protein n=1 Tax=Pholiota conissans TaxID=109636 RepID=A0A9P5YZ88_9AGAR|nr:hypothetical protein BDN70DRAFT_159988 [Pholiota conissans]
MGNSASKATRKYPSRADIPNLAARNGAKATRPEIPVQSSKLADSHRSEAIEKDAGDPDFLSNLSRLGPVRVDHHMQSDSNNTTRLFESRAKSEQAASVPTKNQLYAFVLSDLLDRRKAVRSRQELEKLANEFNIDVAKLESLARFVNSPSIDKATIRPIAGKSEEDGFMVEAVWIEPQVGHAS